MNVAHNINSDGWFTTLDAQFRPLPDVKKSHYNEVKNAKPYYSPFYLQEIYQIIKDKFYNINWKYGNPTNNKKVDLKKVNGRESFTLAQITEYMTKIEPYNFDFPSKRSSIKSIYSFEVTDEITKELGDKNWIGSFNYECPQEYEMIEGSNMVGGEIVYSRKDVKYLDINGAINDLQYYQPYPVQFLPGEKLYFVYNEDGAGFFTDESGVKYENLKKFDTPIGQAMTFAKKRPLTEYEKEKRIEAKIDYTKPGKHKPRI